MAEQSEYDDTVSGVNEYLDGLKSGDDQDLYQDERERLLGLEQDKGDEGRKGILEGPHAFDGGTPAEESSDEPTGAQVAFDQAQELGVNHDAALVEHVPNATATEAAPDDLDEDPQSSVLDDGTYQVDPPKTMQEQSAPSLEGEAYQRGYFGEVAADKVQTNAEAVAAVPNKDEE